MPPLHPITPAGRGRDAGPRLGLALLLAGWMAGTVCGTNAPSVTGTEDTSGNLLRNAQAALADELYPLAESRARQYLALPDLPPEKQLAAAIVLARARHGLQDYAAARELLRPWRDRARKLAQADELDFWLATAEFELGNWQSSLELIADFGAQHPGSTYLPFVLRLRAWLCLKSGRQRDALEAFAEFTKLYGDLPEDAANRLDWGRALVEAGETGKAREILAELVKRHPAERAGQQGRILLARLLLSGRQPAAAREALQPLLQPRNIPDEIRGLALLELAAVAEAETNQVEAINLIDQCLTRVSDPQLKNEAGLRKGELLLRLGKTDEGTALIRGFVAAAPAETAAAVQLNLGQTLQRLGLPEKALAEFQNYIETFTDPGGLAQAWQARGALLAQLNRQLEAAGAFEKAAELEAGNPARARLLSQAGDALLAAGQFQAAGSIYQRVIELAPATELADQALFQTALCLQKQNLAAEALEALWILADAGADELLTARAFLQIGAILQEQGNLNQARALYQLAAGHGPAPARAAALYQLGLLDYRLGRFQPALLNFKRILDEFPRSEAGEMSAYMQGWCHYMLREDARAVASFQQFLQTYPNAPRAPDAQFWLAENHFNRGAYYLAENDFLGLTRAYPDAPLADDALFWAGRAALMQQEFRRANEHFALLIRRYPDTNKQAEARFYQGEALCELGEFAGAILIFDEIIKQAPDSYLAERAWFRKGDSQFTLGSEDPQRYEEAIASYRMILNRADAAPAARMQAEYKIGRCLEKTGQTGAAFENYMNVVYNFFNHPQSRAKNSVWFTRAAFNAAAMMEEEKAWRKAVAIYQRVVDAKVAASHDAAERIRKIRLDQWMFFY